MSNPISLTSDPLDDGHNQYLTFLLGREMFGIDIRPIMEIIEYRAPTAVPMMPPSLRGVINLRGAVVPVVDLAQRFGRGESEVSKRSCIVIIEVMQGQDRHVLGLLVDAVSEVLEIARADVSAPPSFGSGIRTDFIHGMGKVGERFVVLLDTEVTLSVEELAVTAGYASADQAVVAD